MIVSFRDKRTREFAEGGQVKAFSGFSRQAEMKLDQLEAATTVQDLAGGIRWVSIEAMTSKNSPYNSARTFRNGTTDNKALSTAIGVMKAQQRNAVS